LVRALVFVPGVTLLATLLPIQRSCQIEPAASLRFE
jgi:hypothetical protein